MTTMAEGMLRRAVGRAADAGDALKHGRKDVSISNSIEAIECAVKAAFLLLSVNYPKKHDFDDKEFTALFESIPDRAKHFNFPRLFVLYKLWLSFYLQAKYGNEYLNIAATDLFEYGETELALTHAQNWIAAVAFLAAEKGLYI